MAKKIIGAFVFKDLGDGCLVGKWLNSDEPPVYPQAAKLEKKNKDGKEKFCGIYVATWVEQINVTVNAKLEITRKKNSTYRLKWYDADGPLFFGNAMVYENSLVGTYWD